MNKDRMRFSSYVAIVGILSMSIWVSQAQAVMISSEQVIDSQAAQHDRDRLRALLARADVRKELLAHGVNADAAQARVDALTDSEVASLSGQLGNLPAAGDDDDNPVVSFLTFLFKLVAVLGMVAAFSGI